jgi:hypothetical protein
VLKGLSHEFELKYLTQKEEPLQVLNFCDALAENRCHFLKLHFKMFYFYFTISANGAPAEDWVIGSQICSDHSLKQFQLLSLTCAEVTFLF